MGAGLGEHGHESGLCLPLRDEQQQLAVAFGVARRGDDARIAIEFHGEPDAARHPPDRGVPGNECSGQRGADDHGGVAAGTMLLFVTEHQRAERRLEVEQPARHDDPRLERAVDRGAE